MNFRYEVIAQNGELIKSVSISREEAVAYLASKKLIHEFSSITFDEEAAESVIAKLEKGEIEDIPILTVRIKAYKGEK